MSFKGNPQGKTLDLFDAMGANLDAEGAQICEGIKRVFLNEYGRGLLKGGAGLFDLNASVAEGAVCRVPGAGPGWVPSIEGNGGFTFAPSVVPASADLALASLRGQKRMRIDSSPCLGPKRHKPKSISDELQKSGQLNNVSLPDCCWLVPHTADPLNVTLTEGDLSFWGNSVMAWALKQWGALNLGLPLCRRLGLLAASHFPLLPDVGNPKFSKHVKKGADRDLGKFLYDMSRNRTFVRRGPTPTMPHCLMVCV